MEGESGEQVGGEKPLATGTTFLATWTRNRN